MNMGNLDFELLAVPEAARLIGVSVSFMNKKRLIGDGCPYRKIGRRVFYDLQDLKDWVGAQRRSHTSES